MLVGASCWLRVASAAPGAAPALPAPALAAAEARAHHARALAYYDQKQYAAALAELRRAQELDPRYEVLFNIGQLEFLLEHHAAARSALERYLREGGDRIAPARQHEVKRQLHALGRRTAELAISVNVPGARVSVQGAAVGVSPLRSAVYIDPGRVRVHASKAGRGSLQREVHARAGQSLALWLELGPEPPVASGVSPLLVAGWVGAGALALGATGSLVMAQLGERRHAELRAQPAPPDGAERHRARLDDQRAHVRSWSMAGDVLAVGALALGVVSLYFTLQPGEGTLPARELALGLSPGGAFAAGSF